MILFVPPGPSSSKKADPLVGKKSPMSAVKKDALRPLTGSVDSPRVDDHKLGREEANVQLREDLELILAILDKFVHGDADQPIPLELSLVCFELITKLLKIPENSAIDLIGSACFGRLMERVAVMSTSSTVRVQFLDMMKQIFGSDIEKIIASEYFGSAKQRAKCLCERAIAANAVWDKLSNLFETLPLSDNFLKFMFSVLSITKPPAGLAKEEKLLKEMSTCRHNMGKKTEVTRGGLYSSAPVSRQVDITVEDLVESDFYFFSEEIARIIIGCLTSTSHSVAKFYPNVLLLLVSCDPEYVASNAIVRDFFSKVVSGTKLFMKNDFLEAITALATFLSAESPAFLRFIFELVLKSVSHNAASTARSPVFDAMVVIFLEIWQNVEPSSVVTVSQNNVDVKGKGKMVETPPAPVTQNLVSKKYKGKFKSKLTKKKAVKQAVVVQEPTDIARFDSISTVKFVKENVVFTPAHDIPSAFAVNLADLTKLFEALGECVGPVFEYQSLSSASSANEDVTGLTNHQKQFYELCTILLEMYNDADKDMLLEVLLSSSEDSCLHSIVRGYCYTSSHNSPSYYLGARVLAQFTKTVAGKEAIVRILYKLVQDSGDARVAAYLISLIKDPSMAKYLAISLDGFKTLLKLTLAKIVGTNSDSSGIPQIRSLLYSRVAPGLAPKSNSFTLAPLNMKHVMSIGCDRLEIQENNHMSRYLVRCVPPSPVIIRERLEETSIVESVALELRFGNVYKIQPQPAKTVMTAIQVTVRVGESPDRMYQVCSSPVLITLDKSGFIDRRFTFSPTVAKYTEVELSVPFKTKVQLSWHAATAQSVEKDSSKFVQVSTYSRILSLMTSFEDVAMKISATYKNPAQVFLGAFNKVQSCPSNVRNEFETVLMNVCRCDPTLSESVFDLFCKNPQESKSLSPAVREIVSSLCFGSYVNTQQLLQFVLEAIRVNGGQNINLAQYGDILLSVAYTKPGFKNMFSTVSESDVMVTYGHVCSAVVDSSRYNILLKLLCSMIRANPSSINPIMQQTDFSSFRSVSRPLRVLGVLTLADPRIAEVCINAKLLSGVLAALSEVSGRDLEDCLEFCYCASHSKTVKDKCGKEIATVMLDILLHMCGEGIAQPTDVTFMKVKGCLFAITSHHLENQTFMAQLLSDRVAIITGDGEVKTCAPGGKKEKGKKKGKGKKKEEDKSSKAVFDLGRPEGFMRFFSFLSTMLSLAPKYYVHVNIPQALSARAAICDNSSSTEFFEFDAKSCGSFFECLNSRTIISAGLKGAAVYATASPAIQTGTHHFEVHSSSWPIAVGITTAASGAGASVSNKDLSALVASLDKSAANTLLFSVNEVGEPSLVHSANVSPVVNGGYGTRIVGSSGVIGVQVDFISSTISFSINGLDFGPAYNLGDRNLAYFPMVATTTRNNKVHIFGKSSGQASSYSFASYISKKVEENDRTPHSFLYPNEAFSVSSGTTIGNVKRIVLPFIKMTSSMANCDIMLNGQAVNPNIRISELATQFDTDIVELTCDVAQNFSKRPAEEIFQLAENSSPPENKMITFFLGSSLSAISSLVVKAIGTQKITKQALIWHRWNAMLKAALQVPYFGDAIHGEEEFDKMMKVVLTTDIAELTKSKTAEELATSFVKPICGAGLAVMKTYGHCMNGPALHDSGLLVVVLNTLATIQDIQPRDTDQMPDESRAAVEDYLAEERRKAEEISKQQVKDRHWAAGTGYGMYSDKATHWDPEVYLRKAEAIAALSTDLCLLLDAILRVKSTTLPWDSVRSVLQSSCFLPFMEMHIRSISILEMMKYPALYESIITLCKTLARNPALRPLLEVGKEPKSYLSTMMFNMESAALLIVKGAEKMKKMDGGDLEGDEKVELSLAEMIKSTVQCVRDGLQGIVEEDIVEESQAALEVVKVEEEGTKEEKDQGESSSSGSSSSGASSSSSSTGEAILSEDGAAGSSSGAGSPSESEIASSAVEAEMKEEDKDDAKLKEKEKEEKEKKEKEEKEKKEKEKEEKEKKEKEAEKSKKKGKGKAKEDAGLEEYCAAFVEGDLMFGDYPVVTNREHHYRSNLSTSVKKPVLRRIIREQASLSSNLPLHISSSVWLRVDEDRPDFMQAMISGPEGTPYCHGMFLFDIYCPPTYPQVCPKVNLMTTGYGAVRFNPNLYNCGKVCLSLLGTWSGGAGEGWDPKTSTLLQVLVSIQSLIFVPQPYFNEPGYESSMNTDSGKKQSEAYSKNIRLQTTKWYVLFCAVGSGFSIQI